MNEAKPTRLQLVKTKEAKSILACSAWQLRELVHAGRIRPVIFNPDAADWRFDIHDLEKFVDSCRETNA